MDIIAVTLNLLPHTYNLLTAKLKDIYNENPEKVHPYLPRFVEDLKEGDDVLQQMLQMLVIQMFTEVAKRAPEVFSNCPR